MSKFLTATNKSKDILIGKRIRLANNIFTRIVGLLGDSHLPEGDGLLIVPCKSIHSIFMRFMFDAVFLDKNGQVVHIIEKMKPFKLSSYIVKASKVLELPSGSVQEKEICLGDTIEFTESQMIGKK